MSGNGWFKKMTEAVFEKSSKVRGYIPYTDSAGNKLSENEILFTNEESLHGKETLDIAALDAPGSSNKGIKAYTVNSPGIKLHTDDSGDFPIAISDSEGELMYLKVSSKTGEVLPIHAGCCSSIDVIYTGAPQAGKTVNILQMSDPCFHDTIVKNTNCAIEDDLPMASPARRRYEEAGNRLKKHILPEPTKRGELIMPYVYYITFTEGDTKRHLLLRLQDIDGQECVDLTWKSKIFPYNYFFLIVGADELIDGEMGLPVQYTKVVDKLIPRLRVLRQDRNYEMMVIISKCDLLDKEDVHLKDAFDNSIEMKNGQMVQTTHDQGFDFAAFQRRSECVQSFLKAECPNFYNKLMNAMPKQKITFSMVASIGAECENNSFEEYKPFCIDEPIVSILAKNKMYPIAYTPEKIYVEQNVRGISEKQGNLTGRIRRLWESAKKDDLVLDEDDVGHDKANLGSGVDDFRFDTDDLDFDIDDFDFDDFDFLLGEK